MAAFTKSSIERAIEEKQRLLQVLVKSTDDLTHPNVIRVSQEIDEYMVQLQKMKMRKNQRYEVISSFSLCEHVI